MNALPHTPGVAFELDGQPVTAHPGETILKAAQRHGVEIPHLCYTDGLRPDGNCRACVVEIAGERTLAPSCCRAPTQGMKVQAASPRARKSQQMVVEMLLSDMPDARAASSAEVAGASPMARRISRMRRMRSLCFLAASANPASKSNCMRAPKGSKRSLL